MSVNPAPTPTPTSWWPPHRKVVASTLAGAAVTVIVWGLNVYGHVNQPLEVVAGEVTIVSALIGYLVPGAE